jgi:hypothetical protein
MGRVAFTGWDKMNERLSFHCLEPWSAGAKLIACKGEVLDLSPPPIVSTLNMLLSFPLELR